MYDLVVIPVALLSFIAVGYFLIEFQFTGMRDRISAGIRSIIRH